MTCGMQIVIRADASHVIGHGHVMRCLNLALALRQRGATVRFVCRPQPGHLCELISGRGFAVDRLRATSPTTGDLLLGARPEDDAMETRALLEALAIQPDWLIIDSYGADVRWEKVLRGTSTRIFVIDDLANRPHDCDLLLDQNLVSGMEQRYSGHVADGVPTLLGPSYALLHPTYAQYHSRMGPRRGSIASVLIAFGGADVANMSGRALAAVLAVSTDTAVDVVLSSDSLNASSVRELARGEPRVRVHERVPSLAQIMASADLAIGAAGTTSWERLCLGLPSLVITLADNQRPVARALHSQGLACWLGDAADVDGDVLERELARVFKEGLDEQWSLSCMSVVDGKGASRVAAALLASPDSAVTVRHATLDDERRLLEWSNDVVTRQSGFSTAAIEASSHRDWFWRRLRNVEGCQFYIVEVDGGPAGPVRFERTADEWEIHYAVAPSFRGKGLGKLMLAAALEHFRKGCENETLVGHVKEENIASRRIFDSLGFTAAPARAGIIKFTRSSTWPVPP